VDDAERVASLMSRYRTICDAYTDAGLDEQEAGELAVRDMVIFARFEAWKRAIEKGISNDG
jgi:hypothetical protein